MESRDQSTAVLCGFLWSVDWFELVMVLTSYKLVRTGLMGAIGVDSYEINTFLTMSVWLPWVATSLIQFPAMPPLLARFTNILPHNRWVCRVFVPSSTRIRARRHLPGTSSSWCS